MMLDPESSQAADAVAIAKAWISNGKHFMVDDVITNDGPTQIFISTKRADPEEIKRQTWDKEQLIKDNLDEHVEKIAWHLIFSRAYAGTAFPEGSGPGGEMPIRCLYGWLERVGRPPMEGDLCSLGYLCHRLFYPVDWTSSVTGAPTVQFVSEVCLHISELATDEDPSMYLWPEENQELARKMAEIDNRS